MRPRAHLAVCSLLAGILVATRASPASAELPSTVSVDWSAPSGCPGVDDVRTGIVRLLGPGVGAQGSTGPSVAAEGIVRAAAQGTYVVEIRIRTASQVEAKTIEASSCGTAADAFALIVALTIDPTAGASAPPPPSSPTTSAPPAPAPSTPEPIDTHMPFAAPILRAPEPTARHTDDSPSPGIRGLAGLAVLTGVGALPLPSYGLGAQVAVERAPFRWEVGGAYWPERPAPIVANAARARVQLESLQSAFCVARGIGLACIAGEVGAMAASGTGVPSAGRGTSWWLAASLAAGLRWTAGPVVLGARIAVGVPAFRPDFVFDGVGSSSRVQAYRPAPAFVTLRLEAEVDLFSTDSRGPRHVRK